MNFRHFIQDYFTFGRNERKGIIALLIIIFLLAVVNKFAFYFEKPAQIDSALFEKASRELGAKNDSLSNISKASKLFAFNPNVIDSAALDSLDIPDMVKSNLVKFREKGGRFYSSKDFRKIYGMNDFIYARIEPYLVLEEKTISNHESKSISSLFNFDPNTASDDEFLKLGLSAKQISMIRNYQAKGGKFRSNDDFNNFRGIGPELKEVLVNYIVLGKTEAEGQKIIASENSMKIELNTADSIQLKKLPGIGDVLSKRIVKYRSLLGGFYTPEQLTEVYGVSFEVFEKLKNLVSVDKTLVKKVDLNFSNANELERHPYMQKETVKRIIKFRTKYGPLGNPKVLLDSMILNIDEYARLSPYL